MANRQRFKLCLGKYGAYFYDQHEERALPLEDALWYLNKAIEIPASGERYWSCKIGPATEEEIAAMSPCDPIMRDAAQEGFKAITGHYADVNFSGWGAHLTEVERAVVEGREPNFSAAHICGDPNLDTCPQCGGPADNGHDRCVPPNPYYCSKCTGGTNDV